MSNQRPPGAGEPLRAKKKKKRRRRWLGYTLLVLLGLALGVAGVAGSFVYKAYKSLPAFTDLDPNLTSVIVDNKGQTVYRLAANENRTLIKDLNDIPEQTRWAFVDTEDRRFYSHHGVDFYRMFGAIWSTAKYFMHVKGSQLEGGSTITMQLAGNYFLDRSDQTPMRKVQEMMLAMELEKKYTKEEILLKYLNQVSFGRQNSGLEEAANAYFSKSAKDLTLSEAAMLAGILKGPSAYNPIDNYDGAMGRRAIVLDLMVEHGHLDKATADELKSEKPKIKQPEITPQSVTFTGDWYVDYVMDILTNSKISAKYGTPLFDPQDLYTKGLKIYTALDVDYQKTAEEKLKTLLVSETARYNSKDVPEGAVVMMDPKSGYVKAMVGGTKHEQMLGFNRATDAPRQPGSSIKPLVDYFPAIDLLGWGPATVIDDSPVMLNWPNKDNVWPENYEFHYSGLVNMRYGLEQSLNAVAVRTLQQVTPKKGIEYGRQFGLSTLIDSSMDPKNNDENLSLALGGLTYGVTPLDMTAAYSVLANLGMKTDPVVITKIEDKNGVTIFEATPRKKQVFTHKESVWLMVDIMKGAIQRGTPSATLQGWHGWPAAGKTGTTENWQDAWFMGFTPDLVTGVWTGYDNNNGVQKALPASPSAGKWTGAGPPAKIWGAIMDSVVKQKPADWERPPGLVTVQVCKESGLLPSPLCPQDQIISDYFRKGFEPKQVDNVYQMKKVVKQPWQIPGSTKTIDRYFLWQDGCTGTPEERLMITRAVPFAKHPTDPYNFDRYWPADWINEVPTETCKVTNPPPTTPLPGDPGTVPPITLPPGITPPGTTPPGTTPPGTTPPGTTPPGTTPPGVTPPGNGTPVTPPPTTPGH